MALSTGMYNLHPVLQIDRVLRHIPVVRANEAVEGKIQKVVGRIVPATGALSFVAPASGNSCVYLHCIVEAQ